MQMRSGFVVLAACSLLAGCASVRHVPRPSARVDAEPTAVRVLRAAPESNAAFSDADTRPRRRSVERGQRDEWSFTGGLKLWLPAVDGSFTAGGGRSGVDASFGDTWKAGSPWWKTLGPLVVWKSYPGYVFELGARRGGLGLFANLNYQRLDLDTDLPGTDLELEPKVRLTEFGGTWRLDAISYGGGYERQSERRPGDLAMRFDALLGVRHTDVETDMDVSRAPAGSNAAQALIAADRDEDWYDLIVGLQVDADLARSTRLVSRFDVGGFDIGSSSDRTWNLEVLLHYDFGDVGSTFVGWRVLETDFDRGSGPGAFRWDVRLAGPMFGFEFWF